MLAYTDIRYIQTPEEYCAIHPLGDNCDWIRFYPETKERDVITSCNWSNVYADLVYLQLRYATLLRFQGFCDSRKIHLPCDQLFLDSDYLRARKLATEGFKYSHDLLHCLIEYCGRPNSNHLLLPKLFHQLVLRHIKGIHSNYLIAASPQRCVF